MDFSISKIYQDERTNEVLIFDDYVKEHDLTFFTELESGQPRSYSREELKFLKEY